MNNNTSPAQRPVRIEKHTISSPLMVPGASYAYGSSSRTEFAAIETGTGKVIWTSKRKRDLIEYMGRIGREIVK